MPVPALRGKEDALHLASLLLQGTQQHSKQSQLLEMDKDTRNDNVARKAMDRHQHGCNSFGVTLQGHQVPPSTKLGC